LVEHKCKIALYGLCKFVIFSTRIVSVVRQFGVSAFGAVDSKSRDPIDFRGVPVAANKASPTRLLSKARNSESVTKNCDVGIKENT